MLGQLGRVTPTQFDPRPAPITLAAGTNIRSIACGNYHSLAVTDDDALYSWGCGVDGQLGHGDYETIQLPKRVNIPKVYQVSGGSSHTMALTEP